MVSTSGFLEGKHAQQGLIHCGGPPRVFFCCIQWGPTLQGKYEDAEPLYHRAMEISEATLGKDHPQYSAILGNLAELLRTQVRPRMCRCTLGAHFAGIDGLPPYSSARAVMDSSGEEIIISFTVAVRYILERTSFVLA